MECYPRILKLGAGFSEIHQIFSREQELIQPSPRFVPTLGSVENEYACLTQCSLSESFFHPYKWGISSEGIFLLES